MRDAGSVRKGDRPHGGLLRGVGSLVLVTIAVAGGAMAQDTPEMLAAMQAHLPPVPGVVPARGDLPDGVREAIPAFRIEAHRWSADPALRFVLVHGRRIEEGGVVDRELWLRQVRADGVVLQFRDHFFFQPR